MNSFKGILLTIAILGITLPAFAADRSNTPRRDRYAGYKAHASSPSVERRSSEPPRRVDHQPKLIHAKPLIRPQREYANKPSPADARARHEAKRHASVTEALRSRATVKVDRPTSHRPTSQLQHRRYEDIGKARVVRNPRFERHQSAADITDSAPKALRHRDADRQTSHRPTHDGVVIRSTTIYPTYPHAHHRLIDPLNHRHHDRHSHHRHHGHYKHRAHHHRHHGWRRSGGFIRFSHPIRRHHCAVSTGITFHLRF